MSQQTTRAAAHAWWVTSRPELNDLCPLQLILGQVRLAAGAEEPTKYQAEMLAEPWNKRYARLLDSQCMPDDEMSPAADNDARGALTGSTKTDSHEFIVTTNREHEEWFRAMFVPECEIDLKSLWAWQEQERRKRAALAKLPAGDGLTDEQIDAIFRKYRESGMTHTGGINVQRKLVRDIEAILAAPRQPGEVGAGVQTQDALRWIMRQAESAKEACSDNPESPAAIRNGKLAGIATAAAQALGLVRGPSYAASAQQDERETEAKALKDSSEWLLDVMGDWDFTIPSGAFDKIVVYIAKGDHNG